MCQRTALPTPSAGIRRPRCQISGSATKVSFSPTVVVAQIPKVRLQRNIERRWYQRSEFAEMRSNDMEMLRVMKSFDMSSLESFEQSTSNHITTRGLENALPAMSRTRALRKASASKAVLAEQKMQKKIGICDPSRIASAYKKAVSESQSAAQIKAAKDAEYVRELVAADLLEVRHVMAMTAALTVLPSRPLLGRSVSDFSLKRHSMDVLPAPKRRRLSSFSI